MKTDLTEVDVTTNTALTICASSRQPFKLLQNIQHCQLLVKSKMALSSSASRSISNRPKKIDSSVSQSKDTAQSISRPRTASFSSRQKNSVNTKANSSVKSNGVIQKRNVQLDSKTKIADPLNDNSANSVGSLTSSPKWSHIKNKFENGAMGSKTKTSSLPNEENKMSSLKHTNSKNISSLVPEINLSSSKTRNYGVGEIKKTSESYVNKRSSSPTTSVTKVYNDRNKTENTVVKNLNIKDRSKSRCSSPKNTGLNVPVANKSSLHSSKTSKINNSVSRVSPLLTSSLSKSSQSRSSLTNSSVSLSSNSSKNSEFDSGTVRKRSSVVSISPKPSELDIPSVMTSMNPLSNYTPKCPDSALNSSNIDLSAPAKKSDSSYKSNIYRIKQKHEDKPILNFNRLDRTDCGVKSIKNKQTRNSIISDENSTLGNNKNKSSNSQPSNKQSNFVPKNKIVCNDHTSNQIEKIQEIVKNSQTSSKTIWVKDNAGNWTKQSDSGKSTSVNTISQSKVASLRSKFLESNKDPGQSNVITKSVTTSSVPSKTSEFSRPLAKSNTTSSICDKTFIGDITGDADEHLPSNSLKSETNGFSLPDAKARNSLDGDKSLNIVQRAILSFEGNLALLSPESQRRLKLVNEKVQAQTDDNKILKARKSEILRVADTKDSKVLSNGKLPGTTKSSSCKTIGEPLLSTRSFLTRYQLSNKQNSKEPKTTFKSYLKDDKIKNNTETIHNLKPNDLSHLSKNKIVEKNKNCVKDTKKEDNSKLTNISQATDSKAISDLNSSSAENPTKTVTENEYSLQPNPSFLWCRSRTASSDLSKSSATSSVSLTSSDYRNYYEVQNYYSTLDLDIEKSSDISEEPIYIDSQESTSSDYASNSGYPYQNIPPSVLTRKKNSGLQEEWTDASDDDFVRSSLTNYQISTLKRRRNKRYSSQKENHQNIQNVNGQKRQQSSDTISFTDSNDTLINDEIQNESTYDLGDSNHFYEPVYESLGNYLLEEKEDDNCSISLSPDDRDETDIMQCSLTSLESAESSKPDKDEVSDIKNPNQKKSSNKISQIKRHLSWTKNDIRLELSSKSKKKNGQTSTEIGVKVQEHGAVNTSPKKKTFIKCILRQKSASSIPIKRSPSPKKESALFYVQLTMGREKQRPMSDSVVDDESSKNFDQNTLKARKQSEPTLQQQITNKDLTQRPKFRKVSCGPRIQRPKTPPPLPPSAQNKTVSSTNSQDVSPIDFIDDASIDLESHFYTCLDPDYIQNHTNKSFYELKKERPPLLSDVSNRTSEPSINVNSIDSGSNSTPPRSRKDLKFFEFKTLQSELLKSPFEEEPMYQFYQRDVQQRATLGYSADVSESEFEDDATSKTSEKEYQAPNRPVLHSQLSAMDLVHGEGGQRTLWCEVPEVVDSGILKTIPSNDRKIQEAMFEVITSEASYLKSLNFLMEHFVQCPEFSGSKPNILDKRERHVLFSDIQPVRDVSAQLLADLEKRWLENIVLSNICDIIYHHASNYFSVYVKYCSNQLYQERTLKELKEKKLEFVTKLKLLESSSICQGLDMHSFLMLPMQRITRLPLLIDAIFHRLSAESQIYDSCKMALATVNKIVAECNEGARKMERMEEMLVISQQLDFRECKGLGLLSASRWLVKKGELVQLLMDSSSRRTFGRSTRWCKIQLYLFLFTDLLVVTRKKSDESYSVVDFCPRNMLEVLNMDENMPPLPMRLPSSYRNIFRLTMLHNKEGKEVEMYLSCLLESDRTRWMDALTPKKSENPDEKIYEKWECKQVQCIHVYNAQQPDELSLEEADVVNVFRKITGWFEGERIRDGAQGWFPCSHVREIVNSHVIARNLRQRYRLLMLSRQYLEEQYKAQVAQSKK